MDGQARRERAMVRLHVGEAQKMSMKSVPNRLIHIAQVESVGLEGPMTRHR